MAVVVAVVGNEVGNQGGNRSRRSEGAGPAHEGAFEYRQHLQEALEDFGDTWGVVVASCIGDAVGVEVAVVGVGVPAAADPDVADPQLTDPKTSETHSLNSGWNPTTSRNL